MMPPYRFRFRAMIASMLLAAIALTLAPPAWAAEKNDPIPLLNNLTVAASTTLITTTNNVRGPGNYGAFWTVHPNRDVAIQVYILGTNSGTAAITYKLAQSVDGITYDTIHPFVFSVAMSGTTALTAVTNLSYTNFTGAKFVAVYSVQNAHTAAVTTTVKKSGFDGSP